MSQHEFSPVTGHPPASTAPAHAPLQGLIGTTLSLMSHYASAPQIGVADMVVRQLALLARHPQADAALQGLCTRLFLQWMGPVHLQDMPLNQQWRDVMPAPEATQ
jgi:hypothetical protein